MLYEREVAVVISIANYCTYWNEMIKHENYIQLSIEHMPSISNQRL